MDAVVSEEESVRIAAGTAGLVWLPGCVVVLGYM
jgi:hypothetical protein